MTAFSMPHSISGIAKFARHMFDSLSQAMGITLAKVGNLDDSEHRA